MPARTDFNVAPYWDTFNIDNDFYRVLFRPGFAVQARELTTLQTILQNQIEQFGNHFFKEGTIVIPGSIAYDDRYYAVKIQSTFGGTAVNTYLDDYVGSIITGATSGVTAEVVGKAVTTTDDPDTLFVKYISASTVDNSTLTFTNDEEISANKIISSYAINVASAQLQATAATVTGSAASVTAGIFFVRGFMCRTSAQTITLDKYSNTPTYRIGFNVTESLITPEEDPNLLDNAQGSSNYAAKGAHRFKITLTLAKKTFTETDDSNFIELARVDAGQIIHRLKATEYTVINDMLARRTEDESGNYLVKHFDVDSRENLNDGTNRGIYTVAQGGVETKATLVIGPGKAYVNGYEVDKQSATFLNVDKARTTKAVNNDNVPFNLGNYAKVDNVYSQPDVSEVGTSLNPFDIVKLYDKQTPPAATGAGRGFAYGTNIGQARSRSFEYGSGTVAATTAQYHHYLFDISMYTLIVLSANTTVSAKALITGATSGATGIVSTAVTAGTSVYLMQVEGSFQSGETITSSVSGNTPGSGTISSVTSYDFGTHAKQIFEDTTTIDYTSDIILDQSLTISGEITTTASGTTVTGTNTKFSTELIVGDVIQLPTGAAGITEEFRVSAIASNLSLTIEKTGSGTANSTTAVTSAKAVRIRAKIAEEEETVLVYKTPKVNTSTLLTGGISDTTYSFRKQFIGTTNASGIVTFSAGTGETFDSASTGRSYTMTVTTKGAGSAVAGTIIDLSSTKDGTTSVSGTGTQTLTVTDATLLGNAADVTLMASITVPSKAQKSKTANKMTTKTLVSNGTVGASKDIFGERVIDNNISLSYADVYTLHAVYESAAIGTAPVTPTLTISSSTGTYTVGEIITGSSSGATGRVIINSPSTNIDFVVLTGTFTTNDQVTGGTSGAVATVTAKTNGDRNITSSFLLDTGQRDSYYDLGRASRKPNAVIPVGQLTFVYDYFGHGTGDYFSVDSYTGQVDYADIPQYLSSKVDPDSKAPVGQYELRDSLDFRPSVQNQTAPSTCPFAFENKNFEASGASAGNLVVPDDNVRIDFSFYLGRFDLLYLDQLGNFIIVNGIAAEDPSFPPTDNINMLVARVGIGPYTYNPERDLLIQYEYNKRYTMRDIGKLESRIAKLEYATSLGLLERQTDSFQVLDENGLDRFKSGFIVDNFYGHNIGDSLNDDYECAMDPGLGHMRPKSRQTMIMLDEENTTDSQRTSNYYQKTGDIITLPYTHTAETTQPYASRAESVNPFSVTLWVGDLAMNPETDVWFDEQRVPSVSIDVEGNYEQMLRERGGNADIGTIWDSWNTVGTGNTRTERTNWGRTVVRNGDDRWRQTVQRTTTIVDQNQRRTGVNTRLVERIDNVSMGDRITNIEIIPWMRPRNVEFTVTGLKPNTRVYAFFDRIDVNAEVKPTGSSAVNTLLNGALTKTATTITVDSTTGFPSTGTLGLGSLTRTDPFGQTFIAQEQCTYTGLTSTTFTGVTRNTGFQFTEPQAWADDTYVNNQTYGTAMISSAIGNLTGRFRVPQTETKRFRYGTKTFRLTDSATNSQVVGTVETSADAPYTAQGYMQTKQEVIMNVRNAQIGQVTVFDERSVSQVVGVSERDVGGVWYDPLAQTVLCDQDSGMFITKVDVYFHSKDDALPVWCEVRPVKNGYPGREIFPFSKITLEPSSVNVDPTTAATATTFTFDAPIYIQNRQEFCIVLASNSPNYKVWIARLGETEIGGTRTISTQPTLGSLFKSQNASTWTPSQYEDLKFILYRANFDIANNGSFTLVNEELKAADDNDLTAIENPVRLGGGSDGFGIPTLPENPIDTSSKVLSTTITNGGSGYSSLPAVAFTAPTSGVTATGTAVVTSGAVSAINITNAGEGYTSAPTVSFTGGGGSSAAATAAIASTSVRVNFKNHAMYDTDNNVTISGAISTIGSSALNGAMTNSTTGTVNVDDSSNWPAAGYVKIDEEVIYYDSKPGATSISIPSSGGRAYDSTTAAAHEDNSLVHLYMLGGIPLTEINKTHTSISGIETDSFIITTSTAATATLSGGGKGIQCTKNVQLDVMQTIIQTMELPNTTVTGKLQSTTGTSVSGTQESFSLTTAASAPDVPLNEDYFFDAPQIICSQINETNELSGNKSFRFTSTLSSTDATVSPVIDTKRMGVICVANRLNEIDSSTDVNLLTPYHAMTSSSGDNNNAIYITKKIALAQAATAIQVIFDAVVMSESDIRVLYKTLRADSAENFDDIDWQFFHTDGSPTSTVSISKNRYDFKEYKYFAGKNALGTGTELTEFVAFAIKIVQQGTNSSLPSMVKDFRTIAFQA